MEKDKKQEKEKHDEIQVKKEDMKVKLSKQTEPTSTQPQQKDDKETSEKQLRMKDAGTDSEDSQ